MVTTTDSAEIKGNIVENNYRTQLTVVKRFDWINELL